MFFFVFASMIAVVRVHVCRLYHHRRKRFLIATTCLDFKSAVTAIRIYAYSPYGIYRMTKQQKCDQNDRALYAVDGCLYSFQKSQ